MPATVYKILSKLFLQEVIVPVQTKISDARVVRIYNTALIVTTAMAGLFFVFAWKMWNIFPNWRSHYSVSLGTGQIQV